MRPTLRILRCAAAVLVLLVLAPGAEAPAKTLARAKLTVVRTPEALIVSRDGRIRCGDRCSASYKRGALVTLTVTPESHFSFAGWSRGCIGVAATCTLAVDRRVAVAARFERLPAFFSLTVGGPGIVVSDPPGISCGAGSSDCTETFGAGEKVRFTAQPKPESVLDAWGGDCISPTGNACEVAVEPGGKVMTTFRRQVPEQGDQSLFAQAEGRLQSSPPGIDCPPTCGASFESGTRVTLTGLSSFVWQGDCVGFGSACAVVADTSVGVTATAPPAPPPPGSRTAFVNVTVSGGGVVRGRSILCDSRGSFAGCQAGFPFRSQIELRATALRGFRFHGWSGFCAYRKRNPTCRLLLSTRKNAIAVFKLKLKR